MSTGVRPAWVEKHAETIADLLALYPVRRSALMPLLHLAQEEQGHLQAADYAAVAEIIGEPAAYVESVASFYSMYHRHGVGRYHIVVCGNLSCGLGGGRALGRHLEERLGIQDGQMTADGLISLEVTGECLAACDAAPVLQVNTEYFLRVTPEKADALVAALRRGDAEALAGLAEHPEAGRGLVQGAAEEAALPQGAGAEEGS